MHLQPSVNPITMEDTLSPPLSPILGRGQGLPHRSNNEIAKHMGISKGTVKVHQKHIHTKAGVHSRIRLITCLRQQVVPV